MLSPLIIPGNLMYTIKAPFSLTGNVDCGYLCYQCISLLLLYTLCMELFCTSLQGDGGFSGQEKRATTTLNRSEIIDTEGYSDLPVHSVSIYLEMCLW